MIERITPVKGERQERQAKIAKSDTKSRTISFVASDETVDRYGDIIRADGWNLKNYAENDVLLWAHSRELPPIGNAKAWVDGTTLFADATFAPAGKSAFADEIFGLVEARVIKAVSVGFMPTEMPLPIYGEADEETGYRPITGWEFVGQDLLELSVVPVPANPAALALARSLASEATIRRLFTDDERASAHVTSEYRRRQLTLARLRAG